MSMIFIVSFEPPKHWKKHLYVVCSIIGVNTLQAWRCIYCLMATPALRWLVSATFVLGYSLLVLLSAIIVCWIIFVLPLPPLLTVIASIEQVCCHGNALICLLCQLLLPFSCASVWRAIHLFVRMLIKLFIHGARMMIQAPPTGMLVKCILNLALSLSIYTFLLLQRCFIETTTPGTFCCSTHHIISAQYMYPSSFHRNQGPIRWRYVSVYFLQVSTAHSASAFPWLVCSAVVVV